MFEWKLSATLLSEKAQAALIIWRSLFSSLDEFPPLTRLQSFTSCLNQLLKVSYESESADVLLAHKTNAC